MEERVSILWWKDSDAVHSIYTVQKHSDIRNDYAYMDEGRSGPLTFIEEAHAWSNQGRTISLF